MIEEFHSRKYLSEDKQQKHFTNLVRIMNKSDFENLKNSDIKIDVRLQNLYTTNNRVSNIQPVPGIIEMDSFKMLCKRLGSIEDRSGDNYSRYNNPNWEAASYINVIRGISESYFKGIKKVGSNYSKKSSKEAIWSALIVFRFDYI